MASEKVGSFEELGDSVTKENGEDVYVFHEGWHEEREQGQGGEREREREREDVKPKMAPSRRVAASYETKGWRESRRW